MKIVIDFPPNIEKIRTKLNWSGKTPVFTYGDTLYNPYGGNIDAPLQTHESTHSRQQGDDPEGWWEKYLNDDHFRLEQELGAYLQQYLHFCRNKKDIVKQIQFLEKIAGDLSSQAYGNIISIEDAKKLIKQGTV